MFIFLALTAAAHRLFKQDVFLADSPTLLFSQRVKGDETYLHFQTESEIKGSVYLLATAGPAVCGPGLHSVSTEGDTRVVVPTALKGETYFYLIDCDYIFKGNNATLSVRAEYIHLATEDFLVAHILLLGLCLLLLYQCSDWFSKFGRREETTSMLLMGGLLFAKASQLWNVFYLTFLHFDRQIRFLDFMHQLTFIVSHALYVGGLFRTLSGRTRQREGVGAAGVLAAVVGGVQTVLVVGDMFQQPEQKLHRYDSLCGSLLVQFRFLQLCGLLFLFVYRRSWKSRMYLYLYLSIGVYLVLVPSLMLLARNYLWLPGYVELGLAMIRVICGGGSLLLIMRKNSPLINFWNMAEEQSTKLACDQSDLKKL